MGGGGGSKSTSTSKSYSGSGQKWATPIAQAATADVNSVFHNAQPGLQALTNYTQNSYIPQLQQQTGQSAATAGQGNAHLSNVLSGKYLNGNPYLQGMIDDASGDIMGSVNSMFSRNGRYGSEAHQGVAMDRLADMENQLRYQNYATEMGRMDNAAAGAQGANVANNAQLAAALGLGAELPYTGSNALASQLGALFNGGTSTSTATQKQGGGGLLAAIGGIGAGLASNPAFGAAVFSDRRLKENIVKVGEFKDGLGKYRYTYKSGMGLPDGEFIGVMADEVVKLRPHALGPVVDGFATVNYGAL